jgi:uncharacterized protein
LLQQILFPSSPRTDPLRDRRTSADVLNCSTMQRRDVIKAGLGGAVALTFGPAFWRTALAAPAEIGPGPYGPLGPADALGVRVPTGFSVRLIGQTGRLVPGTAYSWHGEPDGAATFARPGGGWLYVSNSELNGGNGGVGVVAFDAAGSIVDAYRILGGTKWNCAGGATPWGTWLSCEEFRSGLVWECDPFRAGQGVARPGLGSFAHEAAVVDPNTGIVYLTEDDIDGRLYRFVPAVRGDLSRGRLQAAIVGTDGRVTWRDASTKRPDRDPRTTAFARGEGAWFSGGSVYFTTTSDNRVWRLDVATSRVEVIYDAAALGAAAPLREPDNVTVAARSGDIYVAEDADDVQLVLLADAGGRRVVAPFLQFVGHDGSEVTGPAFSPDGSRLYVSSQRGFDGNGLTFEITGPFR